MVGNRLERYVHGNVDTQGVEYFWPLLLYSAECFIRPILYRFRICFRDFVLCTVTGVMRRRSIIFGASPAVFSILTVVSAKPSCRNASAAHLAFLRVLQLLVNKHRTLYMNRNSGTWCRRFVIFWLRC